MMVMKNLVLLFLFLFRVFHCWRKMNLCSMLCSYAASLNYRRPRFCVGKDTNNDYCCGKLYRVRLVYNCRHFDTINDVVIFCHNFYFSSSSK